MLSGSSMTVVVYMTLGYLSVHEVDLRGLAGSTAMVVVHSTALGGGSRTRFVEVLDVHGVDGRRSRHRASRYLPGLKKVLVDRKP